MDDSFEFYISNSLLPAARAKEGRRMTRAVKENIWEGSGVRGVTQGLYKSFVSEASQFTCAVSESWGLGNNIDNTCAFVDACNKKNREHGVR